MSENQENYYDRSFVLNMVRKDWKNLQFASEEIKNDRDVVLEAVKEDAMSLQYAGKELRGDKSFVIEAIKRNGVAFRYANPELRSDRDFVLTAVIVDAFSFNHANEELRNDKEFVRQVVRKKGSALRYATENLRNDWELVMEASIWWIISKIPIEYVKYTLFPFLNGEMKILFEKMIDFAKSLDETQSKIFLPKSLRILCGNDGKELFEAIQRDLRKQVYKKWDVHSHILFTKKSEEELFRFRNQLFDELLDFVLFSFFRLTGLGDNKSDIRSETSDIIKPIIEDLCKRQNLVRLDTTGKSGGGDAISYLFFSPCRLGVEFQQVKKGILKKNRRFKLLYFGEIEIERRVRDGRGREFGKDGIILYEGTYKDGLKNGRGEYHDLKQGKVINGIWKDGELSEDSLFTFDCPLIPYHAIQKHLQNSKIRGSGAYGIVYEIKSSILRSMINQPIKEKNLAVKIVRIENTFERTILFNRLKRGIGLCSTCQSEYILSTYGIIRGANEIGYVMELGKLSLDKMIGTKIEMELMSRILFEIANGLDVLHSKFVMHRDLKLANIMLSYDGVVKVTDFDTLKEDDEKWRLKSMVAQSSRIGTPGFLAPEVFQGKQYSLACDVYSYGLMIYSLLWDKNIPHSTQFTCSCGTMVESIFQSNSLDYHVANCNLRPLVTKKDYERFPNFLLDIMIHCWESDPSKRPTFCQIVKIFENEKSKKKCYSIISLQFPKHIELLQKRGEDEQKMLLIQTELKEIVDWLEKVFVGSKVVRLTNKSTGEGIKSDEDVEKLVENEGNPVIEVEFDRVVVSEDESILKKCRSCENLKKRIEEMESAKNEEIKMMKDMYETEKKKLEEEILRLKSDLLKYTEKNKE